jgi:hypothetical protein
LILQHGLTPHLYADDTQIYGSCRQSDVELFSRKVAACVAEVATWMRSNRLQLNVDKTELIWFTTMRRLAQLPTSALPIGGHDIIPSTAERNLGVCFDAGLSRHNFCSLFRLIASAAWHSSLRHRACPTVAGDVVDSDSFGLL